MAEHVTPVGTQPFNDPTKGSNATVAPTNAFTLDKIKNPSLTQTELQFVTICDYEWNLEGHLANLTAQYGYTDSDLKGFAAAPNVVAALTERGIPLTDPTIKVNAEDQSKVSPLTPIQLVVANSMLDLTDTRSTRKKLNDLGVSTKQYSAWLKVPAFQHYLRQRAENLLGDSQHEASLALLDKVMAGDIKAIEFYMELTGRHVKQTAANVNAGATNNNLATMMIRIVEIIVDEVPDFETAARISDRLKGLVTGTQLANAATAPVETPVIAEARQVTPEVQELMNKGLGYNG